MYLRKLRKKILAGIMTAAVLASQMNPVPAGADAGKVLTLGADLSADQVQYVLDFFNVSESEATVIVVTNAEEHSLLEGQYTSEQIGTKTVSCALVNPTASGGIQVKTANMNVVTSERIASILSTSGVTNCEVLAAAPFMVSGTGALAGVLVAYETASGEALDPARRDMAIEESRTLGELGAKIGQDAATLLVNDIKIGIVRGNVTDGTEIMRIVDDTVLNIESQLEQLAAMQGQAAPEKLNQEDLEKLYNYGSHISQMAYNYDDMKVTLQRVTSNIMRETGIQDPIAASFEDLSAGDVLPENSILRVTNDGNLGEGANITATYEEAPAAAQEEAPAAVETTPEAVPAEQIQEEAPAAEETAPEEAVPAPAAENGAASDAAAQEQPKPEGEALSMEDVPVTEEVFYAEDAGSAAEGAAPAADNPDAAAANTEAPAENPESPANTVAAAENPESAAANADSAAENAENTAAAGDAAGTGAETAGDEAAADPEAKAVTGIQLEPVAVIEDGEGLITGTSVIKRAQNVETDQPELPGILGTRDGRKRYALSDIEGNLLTDYSFFDKFSMDYGLIKAEEIREEETTAGILTPEGKIVVPFQYADAKAYGEHWAVGIQMKEAAEDDYDYSTQTDPKKYFLAESFDLYYIDDGTGTYLKTFTREEFLDAASRGELLNIQERTGKTITTYDSTLQVLSSDARSLYDFWKYISNDYETFYDPESRLTGVKDAQGNIILQPVAESVSINADGYFAVRVIDEEGNPKEGLYNEKGEEILPAVFDKIQGTANGPVNEETHHETEYSARGYYGIEQNGNLGYAVKGGTITCEPKYSANALSNRGAAAGYQHPDGACMIIAADGTVTSLDKKYTSADALNGSYGYLWTANSERYDLLDWHGNVLLEGYAEVQMSGDGQYVAARKTYLDPTEVYLVKYISTPDETEATGGVEGSVVQQAEEAPAQENAAEPQLTPTPTAAPQTSEQQVQTPGQLPQTPAQQTVIQPTAAPIPTATPEPTPTPVPTATPEPTQPPVLDLTDGSDAGMEGNAEIIPGAPDTFSDGQTTNTDPESLANLLENTISTLETIDFEAGRETILQVLSSEIDLLQNVNPGAAAMVSSARALVESGAGDAASVILLLQNAIAQLRGE